MRRCYSTKTIEEIERELDQKGEEYWKYLLTKCLQDKSLDVLEHFTLSLVIEEMEENRAGELARKFPYLRILQLRVGSWLVSLNARTLVELWRDASTKDVAGRIVSELDESGVCPTFNKLVFGERVNAR
jgi:hypothetical protein